MVGDDFKLNWESFGVREKTVMCHDHAVIMGGRCDLLYTPSAIQDVLIIDGDRTKVMDRRDYCFDIRDLMLHFRKDMYKDGTRIIVYYERKTYVQYGHDGIYSKEDDQKRAEAFDEVFG